MIQIRPIAHIKCQSNELYELPSQGSLRSLEAEVIFTEDMSQAIQDLTGIERLWLIFHFHLSSSWKAKVFPPRGNKKISVLATRSPHRPNPLGLSCVKLLKVNSNSITIIGHDLIDGTPIFDIKPYIPFADAFENSAAGWIDEVDSHQHFDVIWEDIAQDQIKWLEANSQWQIKRLSSQILSAGIRPDRDRIKALDEKSFELSCKSWRLRCYQQGQAIHIDRIYSGYDQPSLEGPGDSPWQDMNEHREFQVLFPSH
ncbi:tRNA (N6-threonylcarbamoyladenosine(37)-N6)-methyltransferase TrmO [Lentisphaera profundi]|uniref:tRNA (N6-threonylcarbamoyladenosine(37)-N6)-methyltransferase TrmO n=1 Tax=Lentisphaera profundi TaxID=1658616 RepID=A0ABY7VSB0_9BACT|nr:tRNA (N6-threonylcarbamoyladenosine(37)-N6)-methyltransferase TrmO [Lentisphaera profundi]WDE96781.1 tRNA (N6-threonylcarbamoyladenosine(37)-N6)-methyltransferase TrmO [Lentisphaera profundi]